jgi:hypothetical protein
MFIKERETPIQLVVLRTLKPRFKLSHEYLSMLVRLENGLIGEDKLDVCIKLSGWKAYVVPDLRWAHFQIDTVVIANGIIHLLEVKHYQGECYFQDDRFFYPNHFEIKNPLHQAADHAIALKQILRDKPFQIKHWVIFTNPDFTLKQAKRTDPIIMPNQIERHFEQLRQSSSPLTNADYELAMQLLQLDNPSAQLKYLDIPSYDFSQIQKGLKCKTCHTISVQVSGRTCFCQKCGCRESIYPVVKEAIQDFAVLFPENLLTVSSLYDFCGKQVSTRVIRTTLMKEYELVHKSSASYYR